MASKFYAVKKGKVPGIYKTWDDCKKMVDGYSGAIYKSFKTLAEAEEFIGGSNSSNKNICSPGETLVADKEMKGRDFPKVYAFVDGSYNIATKTYGYGGFLIADGVRYQIQGSGTDSEMASMRNVAGEVLGSVAAIKKAIELGLKSVSIYYDYMGIECWATGSWKRNKKGTIEYYDFIQSVKDKIDIRFIKVKGHSGVDGNEEADRLAKEAVGIM